MWSFVVQNNYDNILCKTRRTLSLKKALTSVKLSMLTKNLVSTFSIGFTVLISPYANLYYKYLKKHVWKPYNSLFVNNEGLLSNNLSKSYYQVTTMTLLHTNSTILLTRLTTRIFLQELNVVKIPITASTFNSLLWLIYSTLVGYYPTYPKYAKFSTPYTWVLNSYWFDSLLNKFYYKLYKY